MSNTKLLLDALQALESFDKAAVRFGWTRGHSRLSVLEPAPEVTNQGRLYLAAKARLRRKIEKLAEL